MSSDVLQQKPIGKSQNFAKFKNNSLNIKALSNTRVSEKTLMDTSAYEILQSQHLMLADIAAFDYLEGSKDSRIIISAPHGGFCYPHDLYQLDTETLRRFRSLEDIGTSLIAKKLHQHKYPVISANLPRGVLDLNRPATALDALLFDSPLPDLPLDKEYKPYVTAGYGVIPRLSGAHENLHNAPLCLTKTHDLIKSHYHPYHDRLCGLLEARTPAALLVDIHSMPDKTAGKPLADFVFGDDFGVTLPFDIRPLIDSFMAQSGYSFGWNYPYAGGYITRHYGGIERPSFSLQIEINRRLYSRATCRINKQAITEIATLLSQLIAQIEPALAKYSAANHAAE